MNKIILLLSLLFVFASCGTSQNEIESAKQDLLWETVPQVIEPQEIENTKLVEAVDSLNGPIQIIEIDRNSPLSFDTISEHSLTTGEVIITWNALPDVEKIEVFFTNPTSKYPDDRYMLQAYKSGDATFKYIASSKNQVLDFGQNEYVFRAYSEWKEYETKIILEVEDESSDEETGTKSNIIGPEENTISINLPTSSKYGDPIMLGESSFTYSQIKGLEVQKEILDIVSCDTLTEYLSERLNVWYYWNTCRDIVKDKWIKFNVIRLDEQEYVYEKHYVDFTHGFYWVYELEAWKGVDSENIKEKNEALKNRDFPSLEIVDDLMKDIVNT